MHESPHSSSPESETALFRRVADGLLNADEFAAFEQRLLNEKNFRERYVLFMGLEADFYSAIKSEGFVSSSVASAANPRSKRSSSLKVWLSSAVCLVLGLLLGGVLPKSATFPNPVDVATTKPVESPVKIEGPSVAIVTFVNASGAESSAADFRWNGKPAALKKGDRVSPGVLSLKKGEAQLDFVNGAQVVLHGPAELKILSELEVDMISGQAAVRVPDSARGFVFTSPGAAIVDLGTEFSVDVVAGESVVHVNDGEVEISLLGKDGNTVRSERLKDHQSLKVVEDSFVSIELNNEQLLRLPSREVPELQVTNDYVAEVKAASPFAYWRFQEMDGRVVRNEMGEDFAAYLRSEEATPSITVEGGVSHYRKSSQPRHFTVLDGLRHWNRDAYSIELWACPSRLHHGAMIDILNEDWTGDLNTIEIAMKTPLIHRPGALRFFHRHPPGQSAKSGINLFDHDTCLPGQWSHIVATKTADRLVFFVNGQLVSEIAGPTGSDDALYQLSIGQMDRDSLHRQFEGAIDEVALYDYALTPAQVERHYRLLMPTEAGRL